MNKIKSLVLCLSLIVFSSMASANSLIPVPISEDAPLRMEIGGDTSFLFSPLSWQKLGAGAGLAYGFGGGFEGGFRFRGGVNSDRLFQTGSTSTGAIGADVMLRYIGNISDSVYTGLQGRLGYDFTFGQADITTASNLTASVGLPFGLNFGGSVVSVYLMPEIDFGRRAANSTDGVFGSLVGFGAVLGAYVCLGTPKIYLEVKPKTLNIANTSNSWAMDASLGLALEI